MDLTVKDVLKGENIVNYFKMDDTLSDEEQFRLDHEQKVRLIRKGARMMPDHLTREEAQESMIRAGSHCYREWLDANESKLDPYDLYWLTVDAYSSAPYKSIPKERIIGLRKIRPDDYLKDLDPDLADIDPITVYRGGSELPRKVKSEFSWTTDLTTAINFYSWKKETYDSITGGRGITKENIDDVWRHGVPYPALWKATISKDKIIATLGDRTEYEILQHGSVKDIQEIKVTDEQIEAAWHEWNKR